MTQPTLELKSPIIKEAWLDFATLFDASDVFTNLAGASFRDLVNWI